MYTGKVLRSFVDRYNRDLGVYRPGRVFESEDLDRMKELAAGGYIEFKPPKQAKSKKEDKDGVDKADAGKDGSTKDPDGANDPSQDPGAAPDPDNQAQE